MIQGGDPTGTGDGGPGYTIKDEFAGPRRNVRGTVAMAKNANPDTKEIKPDSAGSQFYINLADNERLDENFTPFGEVVSGMDVVDAVASVELKEVTEYYKRPVNEDEVRIKKAHVI